MQQRGVRHDLGHLLAHLLVAALRALETHQVGVLLGEYEALLEDLPVHHLDVDVVQRHELELRLGQLVYVAVLKGLHLKL